MVIFRFIWNCIIGWFELLDAIPVYDSALGTLSALDLILTFLLFVIFIRLLFVAKED